MGGMRNRRPGYPCDGCGDLACGREGRVFARPGARGLGRRGNWEQLVKFCFVGVTGYIVNLWVFGLLVLVVGLHYIPTAVCSFLVAVTNNYAWNRLWTFRDQRGHVAYQGMRFLVVSTLALVANLGVLYVLVRAGLPEIASQAIAIVLVTPINFVGNSSGRSGRLAVAETP